MIQVEFIGHNEFDKFNDLSDLILNLLLKASSICPGMEYLSLK